MLLTETAFYKLGAGIYDDKRRIRELAEEKCLVDDEESCRSAQRVLCLPNRRVEHEVAWLPGVTPQFVGNTIRRARAGDVAACIPDEVGSMLHPLAYCNLLALALHVQSGMGCPINDGLAESLITSLAEACEKLTEETVRQQINVDREESGFPPIGEIGEALSSQQRFYVSVLRSFHASLQRDFAIQLLTRVIEKVTLNGKKQNYYLLDELVSAYELSEKESLDGIEKEIGETIVKINASEERKDHAVTEKQVDILLKQLCCWNRIAQPIQLSYKSRGIAHRKSKFLCRDVRELAIDIFSKYNDVETALHVISMLLKLFREVPAVLDDLIEGERFLKNDAEKIINSREISEIYDAYKAVPASKGALLDAATKLLATVKEKCPEYEKLSGSARDMLALVFTRFGVKLVNIYSNYEIAGVLLTQAELYAHDNELKKLCAENTRLYRANQVQSNTLRTLCQKKLKQFWVLQGCVFVLAAVLLFILFHVNSEDYRWHYNIQDETFAINAICRELQENRRAEAIAVLRKKLEQRERTLEPECSANDFANILEPYTSVIPSDSHVLEEIGAEEDLFRIVQRENTLDSWRIYAQIFPNGKHHEDARMRIKGKVMRQWVMNSRFYTWECAADLIKNNPEVGLDDLQKNIIQSFNNLIGEDAINTLQKWIHARDLVTDAIRDAAKRRMHELEKDDWNALPRPYSVEAVKDYFKLHPSVDAQLWQKSLFEDLNQRDNFTAADVTRWSALPQLGAARKELQSISSVCAKKTLDHLKRPYKPDAVRRFLVDYPSGATPQFRDDLLTQINSEIHAGKNISAWANIGLNDEKLTKLVQEQLIKQTMSAWKKLHRPFKVKEVRTFLDENKYVRLKDIEADVLADLRMRFKRGRNINWKDVDEWYDAFISTSVRSYLYELKESRYNDFSYVRELDTRTAYEKYLARNPKGKFASQARQKLVDLDVDDIEQQRHSNYTPSYAGTLRRGTIHLTLNNDTKYTLTVMYSGPKSIKLSLEPNESIDISLPSGNYRIAVKPSSFLVLPFFGEEYIGAGYYEESFYIKESSSYHF